MTQEEFNYHRHMVHTYDDVDSRVALGSLSTEKYWELYGGYPFAEES